MATARRAITIDGIKNAIKRGDYATAMKRCDALAAPLLQRKRKINDELAVLQDLRVLADRHGGES